MTSPRAATRVLLLALVGAAGCAGGPRAAVASAIEARDLPGAVDAYERFRETDGPDADLLGSVARLLLEEAALGDDPAQRDAALSQLRMAGTAALPGLRRVADGPEVTVARARALVALAERGESGAKAQLYAWVDSDDADILAAALVATSIDDDRELLLASLSHTAAVVRSAAALRLANARGDGDVRLALAESCRVDPDPSVREFAARALGSLGAASLEALRERLGDPDVRVRLAVVRALVQADRDAALPIIEPLLHVPPSVAGIEAARVLAVTGRRRDPEAEVPPGAALALGYLRQALVTGDAAVRGQAALALSSLPPGVDDLDVPLLAALEAETDPSVKLSIARALADRPGGAEAAQAALVSLLDAGGMPALQAAGVLAEEGHQAALDLLEGALSAEDVVLRRAAARLMARGAMRPDVVRPLLTDEDALVRIHAAGGILAAASAS